MTKRTRPRAFRCPDDLDRWVTATFPKFSEGVVTCLRYAMNTGQYERPTIGTMKRKRRGAGMTP